MRVGRFVQDQETGVVRIGEMREGDDVVRGGVLVHRRQQLPEIVGLVGCDLRDNGQSCLWCRQIEAPSDAANADVPRLAFKRYCDLAPSMP